MFEAKTGSPCELVLCYELMHILHYNFGANYVATETSVVKRKGRWQQMQFKMNAVIFKRFLEMYIDLANRTS